MHMMDQPSGYMNTEGSSPPGKVLLISSGEISSSGRKMHERILMELSSPIKAAIMETPAGFELNSALVAEKVGDFLKTRLRNFSPDVSVIAARNRVGSFSTDDPDILAPMLNANYIFLGAGSPTYVARHLNDSLGLRYILGRHRMGATLCLASASAMAFGSKVIPVYEIFKAGHELHWTDGLNLFGFFGLDVAVVSHWDNREGGAELDTSCCFIGRVRMEKLRSMLPTTTILGIDEHTGVLFDFENEQCEVMGKGKATIQNSQSTKVYEAGEHFPIQMLGAYHPATPIREYGNPVKFKSEGQEIYLSPSGEVLELLQKRELARRVRNWTEADELRNQVANMVFEIHDTGDGPKLKSI